MTGDHIAAGRPSKPVIIENVPFFPQSQYQCGPASLAGVLNYYGDTIRPGEISDVIYRKNIRGTVSLDIALYARQRGFSSRWFKGSVKEIQKAVDEGSPLVVMVDMGLARLRAYHFMVVTGYSSEEVIVNTGKTREKRISWVLFLSQWEKTQNWSLLITPKPLSGRLNQNR